MNKESILEQLNVVTKEFTDYCSGIQAESFFQQPADKWSIAQNVQHLTTSANSTSLAFSLPKFIVRIYAGKPNRPSRTFEELEAKYNLKLKEGGKASGKYVPDKIPVQDGKDKIMMTYSHSMQKLERLISKKWKDPQLDQYIAPHPLLGKITLRELCYFTIFHTRHHLKTIKNFEL